MIQNKGGRILFGSLLFIGICQAQITFEGKDNPHGAENCAVCHKDLGKPSATNFDPKSCDACHSRAVVNDKIHQLDDVNVHADGIILPEGFKTTSPDRFDCITCHTVVCKTDRANQTFLRGGPYKSELDFCYQCHSYEQYEKVNPHLQVQSDGSIDKTTCLHCHTKQPEKDDHPTIAAEMQLEMAATCNKCHFLHSHEENHQGKSIELSEIATVNRFLETQKQYGIKLPLSEDNQIQCNTCHYTHNRGALESDQVVFAGDGDNLRFLRLAEENLCYACHDL